MDDPRSRALLATALHPSASPNERLMALSALGRAVSRAGLHPSDLAIVPHDAVPCSDDRAATQETMRREAEIVALTRRVKAQEKALREAGREAEALRRQIAALEATLAERDAAAGDDACRIAALEADLAARDRRISSLQGA
jgi:septal ring factor EnvC (AmiA/AmiB activator)